MFRVGLILASPQRRPMKQVDTLGIEPRASRMLSGYDTTTPCAQLMNEKNQNAGGQVPSL